MTIVGESTTAQLLSQAFYTNFYAKNNFLEKFHISQRYVFLIEICGYDSCRMKLA